MFPALFRIFKARAFSVFIRSKGSSVFGSSPHLQGTSVLGLIRSEELGCSWLYSVFSRHGRSRPFFPLQEFEYSRFFSTFPKHGLEILYVYVSVSFSLRKSTMTDERIFGSWVVRYISEPIWRWPRPSYLTACECDSRRSLLCVTSMLAAASRNV